MPVFSNTTSRTVYAAARDEAQKARQRPFLEGLTFVDRAWPKYSYYISFTQDPGQNTTRHPATLMGVLLEGASVNLLAAGLRQRVNPRHRLGTYTSYEYQDPFSTAGSVGTMTLELDLQNPIHRDLTQFQQAPPTNKSSDFYLTRNRTFNIRQITPPPYMNMLAGQYEVIDSGMIEGGPDGMLTTRLQLINNYYTYLVPALHFRRGERDPRSRGKFVDLSTVPNTVELSATIQRLLPDADAKVAQFPLHYLPGNIFPLNMGYRLSTNTAPDDEDTESYPRRWHNPDTLLEANRPTGLPRLEMTTIGSFHLSNIGTYVGPDMTAFYEEPLERIERTEPDSSKTIIYEEQHGYDITAILHAPGPLGGYMISGALDRENFGGEVVLNANIPRIVNDKFHWYRLPGDPVLNYAFDTELAHRIVENDLDFYLSVYATPSRGLIRPSDRNGGFNATVPKPAPEQPSNGQ